MLRINAYLKHQWWTDSAEDAPNMRNDSRIIEAAGGEDAVSPRNVSRAYHNIAGDLWDGLKCK